MDEWPGNNKPMGHQSILHRVDVAGLISICEISEFFYRYVVGIQPGHRHDRCRTQNSRSN